ncbi:MULTISPECIES: DinB family protein [unclassified Leeuwenhoekiella]|uniref:DinB family protein n=1 Tax=unclassified Leeuwenhoekiella TaxID=2615029 RepID=UPI000C40AD55|nr:MULTISPECIES: DinB family protein [unclassified Leeuwenhoekiella]MAW95835.1 hypothetical protein [Leeuwenhoekiella sp.]MBA82894.1 hypothetical protein [Leeuwenhoekiella sp.]|tara:strand:+ start:9693 stop:10169 length:477 start_codon:yes stop_codon:yes gene_type:complete
MNPILDFTLKNTYKTRVILKNYLETFSVEDLNKIPQGYNNNIFWNIAHLVATQQILVYKFSDVPALVSDEIIAKYRKGTKPEGDVTQAEVDEIKELLFTTLDQTKKDYEAGVFKTYNSITTSMDSTLTNVDEAIAYNNFHEGIHLGSVLALRHAIGLV